jgi:transcriptional regulator with PAS, ATPase and Fis domain
MAVILSRLSPALLPSVYRGWAELASCAEPAAPELVAVWPGEDDRPPFLLDLPVLSLVAADLALPSDELEALLLGGSGSRRPPAPEGRLLGQSEAMARVRGTLVATARNSLPLLLTGENGTGKDLAASVAHELSARCGGPFVAVNCGAIPPGLAETEFFGCVRGAFTGAENRSGYCQLAMGGTLFLDEVGELAPEIQAKLLRVLENKEVRRVGSARVETADFRLICATNRELVSEVKAGRFREDLFYRINVLPVRLPALRERIEDLPLLTDHFLKSEGLELERPVRVGARALDKMAGYSWPGNLRQLRNVVLRAAVLHRVSELEPRHIDWES